VAEHIHHVEGIKSAIAFDVARADQISLVYIIKIKCLGEVRVFNTFGNIGSFF
jgi:hypothetical protein